MKPHGFYVTTPAGYTAHMRGDPKMDPKTLEAIVTMFDLAYEQIVNEQKKAAMSIEYEIRQLAARAERLCAVWTPNIDDEEAWDAIHGAIDQLDARVGPGLAVGRRLDFQVADGEAIYLIDRIEELRVHCVWIANVDERMAHAVDEDGWCLRSVAERKLRRSA